MANKDTEQDSSGFSNKDTEQDSSGFSNKDTEQDSSGFSDGFSAGLKFWLFFMLSFVLVGYPIPLSIFFGAIGGLAGGWVMAWWKSKEPPSQLQSDGSASQERPAKVSGFRLAKLKRQEKANKRRLSSRFGKGKSAYKFPE